MVKNNDSNGLPSKSNDIEIFEVNLKTEIYHTSKALKILGNNFQEVTDGLAQISSASQAISDGAVSQAQDAEKAVLLTKQLQTKIIQMAESSSDLTEKANNVSKSTQSGSIKVDELIKSENNTKELINIFTNNINELKKSAEDIKSILATITNISEQTNLLSLNAAIEAARAGKAGNGFAVVADEIRKLAKQSHDSSKEIEEIVVNINKKIFDVTRITSLVREDSKNRDLVITEVIDTLKNSYCSLSNLVKDEMSLHDEIISVYEFKDMILDSISNVATIIQENEAMTEEMTSQILYQQNLLEVASSSIDDIKIINHHLDALLDARNVVEIKFEREKIGLSLLEKSEFMNAIEAAAIKEAEKMDVELIIKTSNTLNVEEQLKSFHELVDLKVKGIALFPSSASRFIPLVDEAVSKSIPVICIDDDVLGSKRIAKIGVDHFNMGKMAGEAAAYHLSQGGKIVILLCAASVIGVQQRFDGFKKGISNNKALSIIDTIQMKGTDSKETEDNLRSLLQKNETADLLYVVTDESSLIAAKLLKKLEKKIKLVCISNSKEVMNYIKEGYVSSQFCIRNELWGTLLVRRLLEATRGKVIPQFEDTGCYEINKGNVIVFQKESQKNK